MLYPLLRRRSGNGRDLLRVTDDFDRVLERFFGSVNDASLTGAWTPAVDVHESADAFDVSVELPGLTPTEVDVSVENGVLSISGEKQERSERDEGQYHIVERRSGKFSRTFTLPEYVDSEKVDGKFRNGVLELTLPKLPQAKPKKIEIKVKDN